MNDADVQSGHSFITEQPQGNINSTNDLFEVRVNSPLMTSNCLTEGAASPTINCVLGIVVLSDSRRRNFVIAKRVGKAKKRMPEALQSSIQIVKTFSQSEQARKKTLSKIVNVIKLVSGRTFADSLWEIRNSGAEVSQEWRSVQRYSEARLEGIMQTLEPMMVILKIIEHCQEEEDHHHYGSENCCEGEMSFCNLARQVVTLCTRGRCRK
ncbi:hypothetical protein J6590_009999 [Homalodisca vitripennis]|nr:hypothetical protein J6590_009999 [Homalodisca vitripennis]